MTTVSEQLSSKDKNEAWQTKKSTFRKRNAFMFNNQLMSDVTFAVEDSETESSQRRIPAHKYVLAISSPVFFSMFYGPSAIMNTKNTIAIPGCDANSFLIFLRYLYCDELSLSFDIVYEVLTLAKKYNIPSLATECVNYLERVLNPKNVFEILLQAQNFEEKALEERCWQYIDNKTFECVQSDGSLYINRDTLIALLSRDTLEIKEIELFLAVKRWAEVRCMEANVEATGYEMRKVLGDAVFNLRFPAMTMTSETFAEIVVTSGILLDSEVVSVFMTYNNVVPSSNSIPFSQVPRTGALTKALKTPLLRCAIHKEGDTDKRKPHIDVLEFEVSLPIVMFGVRLYGGSKETRLYEAEVQLMGHHDEVLRTSYGKFKTQVNSKIPGANQNYGFDVMFGRPCEVRPGVKHTLHVTMKATADFNVRCKGEPIQTRLTVNGVSFKFYGDSFHILELIFKNL